MIEINNIKYYEMKCNRCLHGWLSKLENGPKNCPKCKSPYFNRARVRGEVKK